MVGMKSLTAFVYKCLVAVQGVAASLARMTALLRVNGKVDIGRLVVRTAGRIKMNMDLDHEH